MRLVRTGVERGWSVQLRRWLRRGGENRLIAAAAGTGAAVVLQSSTAVAILTSNFVAAGTLAGMAGLAVLLGADLGSALVAQILLTRADWLVPVLLGQPFLRLYLLAEHGDCPEVVNLVFARFTRSSILYQQMRGRGTRKLSGKPLFTLFDFVGVSDLHGDADTWGEGGVVRETPRRAPPTPRRRCS